MKLALIVAMASNRVIGNNNQLPWHLPCDLKRFKKITMGSPIIMGRKTFESIGKPLPGRCNIIISTTPEYAPMGCRVFTSPEKALAYCALQAEDVFVIGGCKLYQATLALADTLYITQINQDFEGDTWFPAVNMEVWQQVERQDVDLDLAVGFSYSFLKYERNNNNLTKSA